MGNIFGKNIVSEGSATLEDGQKIRPHKIHRHFRRKVTIKVYKDKKKKESYIKYWNRIFLIIKFLISNQIINESNQK